MTEQTPRRPAPDTASGGRRFGRGVLIAAALVATLASLAVAEAALRILDVAGTGGGSSWFAGGNHPRFLFVDDPAAGYRLRPGFAGREVARSGEFDVAVAIDERGMRARRGQRDGAPAVIALGDSLTFGEGVEAEETFSALLERHTGYAVWNGGVPGYSSRQMLLRMEQLIGSAHPRLVVITLMPLWDAQRLEDPFVYKDGYIVDGRWANRVHLIGDNLWSESVDLPVIGPLSAQAKARSRLVRLGLPAIHRALHAREPPRAAGTAGDEARAAETARQLSLAAQRATASGATLLTVLADSRNDAHIATRQRLETELDRLGVDYVELDRLLDQAAWRRLRHIVDGHWNRAGHAELAAILAPLIQARIAERPGVAPPAAAPAPAVAGAPG